MSTFLDILPLRKPFLMSSKCMRLSPEPCFPRLSHVDSLKRAAAGGGVGA